MTSPGKSVLGVGGKGNMSDVPVLGGLNADRGKLGRFFGLRRPLVKPGDGRGFMMSSEEGRK
jgi:hypothetical protein